MAPRLDASQLSDFVLGKLSPEESLRVLDELERDPEASHTVDFYASLLAYAQGEGRSVFEERVKERQSGSFVGVRRAARVVSRRRWVFAAAAVLALSIFTGLLIRGKSILWGDDAKYAELSDVEFGVGIRAEADDDLLVAMNLFHEGEYDRSIRVLERLMKAEPAHTSPDFVNYSLGVVHLVAAEGTGSGPIRVFDREHVRQGIESLRQAAMLTSSPRLAEEAYWLMAKGHLMVGERKDGIRLLQQVIESGGERVGEARRLKILIESEE